MNGGIQIITDLLSKQYCLVLQICQFAFGCSVTLSSFRNERGVLFPCFIGGLLGFGEQFVGVGRTEQCIAQSHFHDADLIQGSNGAHAFFVHSGKPFDERLEGACGICVPHGFELLGGHAGHPGEIIQSFAARSGSNLHLDQRLGECGTAHFSLNTQGGQSRRKAQNLCFRKPDLMTGAGQTHGHVHDGGFGRRILVTQIDQGSAQVAELALIHVHDVGKLGKGAGRFRGDNIRAVAQVDHGTAEIHQIIIGNTQLTGNGDNLGYIVR